MEQVIEPEQTIAEWVFDLELWSPRFWRDAKKIEQWPDYPVAVFDVVVAEGGEQFPNPTVRLHGAARCGSLGECTDCVTLASEDGFHFSEHVPKPGLRLGHSALVGAVLLGEFVDGFAILPWINSRLLQQPLLDSHCAVVAS